MYFDSDDYTSPLKINLSTSVEFNTVPGTTKNVSVKIRRSDVSDVKNWYPFAPTNSFSFFSVGEITQDTSARSYISNFKLIKLLKI